MKLAVHNRCSDFSSYRAARVKSLFNAESGCNFDLEAELPIDDGGWSVGVIVGPGGSGKSSLGRELWKGEGFYNHAWPDNPPIVDAIAPGGDFNQVTTALSAVGLGSVPAWLRPYRALSNGEKFRADLARILSERPGRVVAVAQDESQATWEPGIRGVPPLPRGQGPSPHPWVKAHETAS